MPIIPIASHHRNSLKEFYNELVQSDDVYSRQAGEIMLLWINGIEEMLPDTTIYGLTSLYHLILKPVDSLQYEAAVKLIGIDNHYSVHYLLPEKLAPWPNAYVSGEFYTLDEAITMTVKAMQLTGLWSVENFNKNS